MIDDVDGLVDLDVLDDVLVAELELGPAPDVRDVLEAAGLEIVETDNPIVARQKLVAEVRAEEARASRHHSGRHLQARVARGSGRRAGPNELLTAGDVSSERVRASMPAKRR